MFVLVLVLVLMLVALSVAFCVTFQVTFQVTFHVTFHVMMPNAFTDIVQSKVGRKKIHKCFGIKLLYDKKICKCADWFLRFVKHIKAQSTSFCPV
jgi:hypothetical protein